MFNRLPLLVRHVMYNLRGGFLVRPLVITLVLGCVGALLSRLEDAEPAISDWVPRILFPSHSDPQVAQIILTSIATSIMTVVSIVFAILLMTLTLASMQFSPRIIVSFAKDRVTQWTLGIFLGTFCYCLVVLPSTRLSPKPFAPVAAVLGAMALSLACVGLLLYFIHHISEAISVNHIVDRIASETEAMIKEMMPWSHRPGRVSQNDFIDPTIWDTAVLSEVSGYIRFIDTKQLVVLAKKYGIKIHALRRIGHFVPAGVPILQVDKGDRLSAERRVELLNGFDLGPSRTLQQDVEFGVLQIVDIALKAISPAVNDPSTAISCVDQLSRLLICYAARESPEPILYDPPGVVRISIPWISFHRLVNSAFEQIRFYSQSDAAVSLRLLRALQDIAITTDDPERQRFLVEQGKRVVAGCTNSLSEEDLANLRGRLASLQTFEMLPE